MALTRRPTPPPSEPLTPFLTYWLVTGRECSAVVDGWVEFYQDVRALNTIHRALWPSVGAQIIAETAPYGFAPWGQTGRRPTGPAVADWTRTFLATHERRRPG